MFCVECGKKVEDNWKFCKYCGASLVDGEVSAPVEESAPAASKRWIPGKRYEIYNGDNKAENSLFQIKSELNDSFWLDYYVVMEDGSQVGFRYMHAPKYKDAYDNYYNLYRLDPDGKATYLNGGSRSGIETLYVQDGYACWDDWGVEEKVKID